jgi:hypothetical protein
MVALPVLSRSGVLARVNETNITVLAFSYSIVASGPPSCDAGTFVGREAEVVDKVGGTRELTPFGSL